MESPNIFLLNSRYHQIQNFDDKLNFLQEVIKKYAFVDTPHVDFLAEVYLMLGELVVSRGWYDEAIDCATRVLDLSKDNDAAMELLIKCKKCIEQYEKALKYHQEFFYRKEIECYLWILNQCHEDVNAWFNCGNAYLLQHEYGKALECYQNVVQYDPQDEGAWFNIGYTAEKLQMFDAAIQGYTAVIEMNSENVKAWLNRGHVYFSLGETEKAKFDYQNAYHLGEDEALYILAEIDKLNQN